MNILHVAYYTVLRNLRDRKSLASMLLFPIILILILGSALSSSYAVSDVGKTPVAYLNKDTGEGSRYFDEFLKNDEIEKMLSVKKVETFEEGKNLISNNKAYGLIVINEDYSDLLKAGNKGTIEVYTGKKGFRVSFIQNIIDSFINGANTITAVQRLGSGSVNYNRVDNIEEMPITTEGKLPRAIDYYAITMLVMILMYGAQYGCHGIGEDFMEENGKRIRTTPIKPFELFTGKTIGTVFTIECQALVLIFFTKFVYKANFGDNLLTITFISFTLSTFATGLGIMLSMVTGDKMKASSILGLVIPVFTFISGGYTKIEAGNSLFSKIMYVSPNYLAQTAMFNSIYGEPVTSNIQLLSSTQCIIMLWILTSVVFLAASVFGRRRVA
jgi:ABC-2 type transport system permease protein